MQVDARYPRYFDEQWQMMRHWGGVGKYWRIAPDTLDITNSNVEIPDRNAKRISITDSDQPFDLKRVLERYVNVESLNLNVSSKLKNLEAVYDAPNLITLGLAGNESGLSIYLANLQNLLDLALFDHSSEVVKFDGLPHLRSLELFKSGFGQNRREILRETVNLRNLTLSFEQFESFEEFPELKEIESVEVFFNKSLESMNGVSKSFPNLKHLRVENCNRCLDWADVSRCTNLRRLSLDCTINLPDVDFVLPLSKLRGISLVNVNVLDGQLSKLHALPMLLSAFFQNKRHYDRKYQDFGEEPNYALLAE